MTYHVDRGLFLENGPTLLAERDRQMRVAGHAYRLLKTPPATPEATLVNRAA